MNDTSVILASLSGATAMNYVGQMSKGSITIRPLIGMFVGGTLLLTMAMFSGDVATAFAVLILITSLVVNGAEVFDKVGGLVS